MATGTYVVAAWNPPIDGCEGRDWRKRRSDEDSWVQSWRAPAYLLPLERPMTPARRPPDIRADLMAS